MESGHNSYDLEEDKIVILKKGILRTRLNPPSSSFKKFKDIDYIEIKKIQGVNKINIAINNITVLYNCDKEIGNKLYENILSSWIAYLEKDIQSDISTKLDNVLNYFLYAPPSDGGILYKEAKNRFENFNN